MSEPKVAATEPMVLDLEPGTYFWCACGRSANQPWCDGSHKGTGFTPVKLVVSERSRHALCMCKATATPPHCDGSHSRF